MTLALVKPAGWDEEDPLTSDEMNALQSELVKAVDGVGGGTYELSSDLVFDGTAPVRIANELQIDAGATLDMGGTLALGGQTDLTGEFDVESGGDVNVKNGGEINVQSGGDIDVESGGAVNVLSGGAVNLLNGSTVDVDPTATINLEGTLDIPLGGSIEVANGGDINVSPSGDITLLGAGSNLNVFNGAKIIGSAGAEIRANDVDDFTINASSYTFYLSLTPIHLAAQWASEESGTFICQSVATAGRAVFPLLLPVGDTITTLRFTIDGGVGAGHGGGAPADRPILELCKVSLDGTVTVIESEPDPVNTGSYDNPHTVTMSSATSAFFPYTITAERHFVRVIGEGITGGVANTTRLCSIDGTALARSVRQTTEIR